MYFYLLNAARISADGDCAFDTFLLLLLFFQVGHGYCAVKNSSPTAMPETATTRETRRFKRLDCDGNADFVFARERSLRSAFTDRSSARRQLAGLSDFLSLSAE